MKERRGEMKKEQKERKEIRPFSVWRHCGPVIVPVTALIETWHRSFRVAGWSGRGGEAGRDGGYDGSNGAKRWEEKKEGARRAVKIKGIRNS